MTFCFAQAVECRGDKYIDILFYEDGSCEFYLGSRKPLSDTLCKFSLDSVNQVKLAEILTQYSETGNPGLTEIILERFAEINADKVAAEDIESEHE